MWGKCHTPTDRLLVTRQVLHYHASCYHGYGFSKKKLILVSLIEICNSISPTFLFGVPRFSDGMFRPECEGLLHVVRAMLTANVRSQTLKIEKFSISPLCFHGKSCWKFRFPPFPVYCYTLAQNSAFFLKFVWITCQITTLLLRFTSQKVKVHFECNNDYISPLKSSTFFKYFLLWNLWICIL